jgi:organic radical activating enzyme
MTFYKTKTSLYDVIKLEIHASHACNFTCESCSHFSNNGHKGLLTPDDADYQMGLWSKRLNPKTFCILGGEPLLNPRIEEFVIVARNHWKCNIELITNGFLLPKFPNLGSLLNNLKINLIITQHHQSKEYLEQLEQVIKFLKEKQIPFYTREATKYWSRRYKGFGPDVLPYEDHDSKTSWKVCQCKYCLQILDGKIYKCPTIAYLQVQKKRWPNISPKWDRYLAYKPLEHTATDQELEDFISKNHESICEMCPAELEQFDKSSPLITVGELLSKLRPNS